MILFVYRGKAEEHQVKLPDFIEKHINLDFGILVKIHSVKVLLHQHITVKNTILNMFCSDLKSRRKIGSNRIIENISTDKCLCSKITKI